MATQPFSLRLLLAVACLHGAGALLAEESLVLSSSDLRGQWTLDAGRLAALTVTHKHTGRTLRLQAGHNEQRIFLTNAQMQHAASAGCRYMN